MYRLSVLFILAVGGCNQLPWLEQAVRLPDGKTVVRIMIRNGGEYRTVVENSHGSASDSHRSIAGGHRRTNLYLAPNYQLVTIESGGDSARFDITPGRAPRALTGGPTKYHVVRPEKLASYRQEVASASNRWRYIGVVYRGSDGFRFYPPSKTPECIQLQGAGSSLFRPQFQTAHSCPTPRRRSLNQAQDGL